MVFSACLVTFFAKVLRPAEAPAPGSDAFEVVWPTFRLRPPTSAASPELRLKVTEELRWAYASPEQRTHIASI